MPKREALKKSEDKFEERRSKREVPVRNKSERQSCRRKQANTNITTSAKFKLRPVALGK